MALSSCATDGSNSGIGAALGGLAGGGLCAVLGGNNRECVAAAVAGAAVGYGIGSLIDKRDREAYNRSVERALAQDATRFTPVNEVSSETGNRISVTSISNVSRAGRPQCKRMQMQYVKSGQTIEKPEEWCLNAQGKYEPVA